jgi:hypothetical protein
MSGIHRRFAAAAFVAAVLASAPARAQDEAPPSPEEMKKKVLEIERLMKGAEESLARSTDTRTAEERAAAAAKKILEDKAKQETGKTPEQLRKEAAAGSAEAKATIERLTKAADDEAKKACEKMEQVLNGGAGASGGAGEGVRKLLENMKGQGEGASKGIQWFLTKLKSGGKGGGRGDDPGEQPKAEERKPDGEKPKNPEKKDDPNQPLSGKKKPDEKTEPPHTPDFEQWIAELPPQVRKAYETQDWDSIPPKWRDMIRAWAEKMSKEDAKEKR